ncbi:MAG: nucleotide exchange factor GrpE [Candidatus Komeilibacteria bacterium]
MVKIKKNENLAEDLAECKAGWLRAKADYQNLQKETEKWKMDFVQYAKADMIVELLPVYSHYRTALEHIPEDEKEKEWVKGIEHIYKLLQDFMTKMSVRQIETVGKEFDHNLHEAIKQEIDDTKPDHTVLTEVQAGYLVGEKVLQPAKVIVNNLNNNKPSDQSPISDDQMK